MLKQEPEKYRKWVMEREKIKQEKNMYESQQKAELPVNENKENIVSDESESEEEIEELGPQPKKVISSYLGRLGNVPYDENYQFDTMMDAFYYVREVAIKNGYHIVNFFTKRTTTKSLLYFNCGEIDLINRSNRLNYNKNCSFRLQIFDTENAKWMVKVTYDKHQDHPASSSCSSINELHLDIMQSLKNKSYSSPYHAKEYLKEIGKIYSFVPVEGSQRGTTRYMRCGKGIQRNNSNKNRTSSYNIACPFAIDIIKDKNKDIWVFLPKDLRHQNHPEIK